MFTHLFLYHRRMAIIVKIDILSFLIDTRFISQPIRTHVHNLGVL